MRVLVTGATGAFGQPTVRQLIHDGAEVVAFARRRPRDLDVSATFVSGDVRDRGAVERAMDGCDAVVHLAWVVVPERDETTIHDINLGGTDNVLAAMERTGCSRLVFASSVTAYGSDPAHPEPYRESEPLRPDLRFHYGADKRRAEERIAESGVDAVVARAATVLGRGVTNTIAHVFAQPAVMGIRGASQRWQFLHQDDIARFLSEATRATRTGVVNVAAPDILELEEVADILDKRVVELPPTVAEKLAAATWKLGIGEVDPDSAAAMQHLPTVDTTVLREEWEFDCAWSSAETLVDARFRLDKIRQLGRFQVSLPSRLPYADPDAQPDPSTASGAAPVRADLDDNGGSLDTLIDPAFGTWSATNLSEAFPGPLTPLTLTVALDTLRAGTAGIVDLLGLDGAAAHESRVRMVGVFAHHLYVNVSAARASVETVPGRTVEDVDEQYLGRPLPPDHQRTISWREIPDIGRLIIRMGPRLAGWPRDVRRVASLAADVAEIDPSMLSDPALVSHLRRSRDALAQGWAAAIIGTFVAGGAAQLAPGEGGHGEGTGLASARALEGVRRLAAMARTDESLVTLLREQPDDIDVLRAHHADFASALDEVLAACGHRGPGETELANPTFRDRPGLLLRAVAAAARDDTSRHARAGGSPTRKARVASAAARRREEARDAAMVANDALRRAVRQRGRRLAESGVLADPDDVFYLTWCELLSPPADASTLVAERRQERIRLADLVMPVMFDGGWRAVTAHRDQSAELAGVGASPGTVRGPARVLQDAADDLEPGDILIARVTDVGWTPLFAAASGVVTNIGGSMSHAAIVAREFGIPAVVGVEGATTAISDGSLIEIDGDAGTVRVVEP